jgi:RimJ/RimL family protein N-acetyltransferase
VVVELAPHAYPRVAPLFAELGHHLSIAAVLTGTMPGRVFADAGSTPQTVLVSSPEGNYLASAGPPKTDLGRALVGKLRVYGPTIELFATAPWERQAEHVVPGTPYHRVPRRRYTLSALPRAWHREVPAPLTLRRIDGEMLARPELHGHHIRRWASGNWGSEAAFLARGFGFALFHDAEPVSWCLADSAVGTRCEIGIHTHPAYRRQGLATVAAAATVAHALAEGYDEVGWHCGEDNRGSQGVAEKVGFALTHRFDGLVWHVPEAQPAAPRAG